MSGEVDGIAAIAVRSVCRCRWTRVGLLGVRRGTAGGPVFGRGRDKVLALVLVAVREDDGRRRRRPRRGTCEVKDVEIMPTGGVVVVADMPLEFAEVIMACDRNLSPFFYRLVNPFPGSSRRAAAGIEAFHPSSLVGKGER
jgi:hypothetical protein